MSKLEKYVVGISILHQDEYYKASDWIKKGEKLKVEYLKTVGAGCVANFCCVASAAGTKVKFFDILSREPVNDALLSEIEKYKVNTDLVIRKHGVHNNKCQIILSGEDRTMLLNYKPKPPVELDAWSTNVMGGAEYVYGIPEGFKIFQNTVETVKKIKSKGAKLVLSIDRFHDNGKDLMPLADILMFSKTGYDIYAGEDKEYYQKLLDSGVQIVVVTRGKSGCVIYSNEGTVKVRSMKVLTIDANGSGDSFNAAFLHGIMKGWTIRKSAKFANASGGMCVTRIGPKVAAVSEAETWDFYKKFKKPY